MSSRLVLLPLLFIFSIGCSLVSPIGITTLLFRKDSSSSANFSPGLDTTSPEAPAGLTLGSTPYGLTQSPVLSWTAAVPGSAIVSYEVQIHNASDNSVIEAWTPLTSGHDLKQLILTDGTEYYFKVRALNQDGHFSPASRSANWTARDSGEAYGFGRGYEGQLGVGYSVGGAGLSTFTEALGDHTWISISAGDGYTCGITTQHEAYCMGSQWGGTGALGIGDSSLNNAYSPTLVAGGHSWKVVSAGSGLTCGIAQSGEAYCWGLGSAGQIGDGVSTMRDAPSLVSGGHQWIDITAGKTHACGITSNNEAYCWGDDTDGQLGNGALGPSPIPSPVVGGHSWKKIASGMIHTCAITTSGAAYCWGNGASGKLGNNASTNMDSPSLVDGGYTWATLDSGSEHTCGITTDGLSYCWGSGGNGELGNIAASDKSTPQLVLGGYSFAKISAGGRFTCGVTTIGEGFCWGQTSGNQYDVAGWHDEPRMFLSPLGAWADLQASLSSDSEVPFTMGLARSFHYSTKSPGPGVSQSLLTIHSVNLKDTTDSAAYEMGMKFKAVRNGKITAIKFYKALSEAGTHTGRIWSAGGVELASVVFSGETASGWQTMYLATPLSITADTIYVVTVNTNSHYVSSLQLFNLEVMNGDLRSIADGANNVFGALGAFPTNSFKNSCYFRDIIFESDP